jgi:SAM-dependent methyltransferase
MQRHDVFYSDRIKAIEKSIRKLNFASVLEIGAGDYSFKYIRGGSKVFWVRSDLSHHSDVICDFNLDQWGLPFSEEVFDLVICTEVLEHLLWPHELLKEAHRVLSSNGKILLSVPNITSLTYRIAWVLGHVPSCAASGNLPPEIGSTTYQKSDGKLIGGHVVDFSLKKILRLIKLSGFEVIEIKGSGIIWHKQILPFWLIPVSFSSNIICLAKKST